MLKSVVDAIEGIISMTNEIEDLFNNIFDNFVHFLIFFN
jgi:hypothetical protein